MLTIAGSGMSDYNIKEVVENIDLNSFDGVFLDKNYLSNRESRQCLEKYSEKLFTGSYIEIRNEITKKLKEKRDTSLLYIVTGSPIFYSAGKGILIHLEKTLDGFNALSDIKMMSNLSCKDYLLNKLAIPEQDTHVLSLHGRMAVDLTRLLTDKYTFILADALTLNKIKDLLYYINPDSYKITMASRLGYPDESINVIDINEFTSTYKEVEKFMPYVLLIERLYKLPKAISDEQDFEKDSGMITKSYKRHLTLQELDIESNLLVWDIGAGSGSIAIDAYKSYRVRTVLFEVKEKRAKDIASNLNTHKVLGTKLVEGNFAEMIRKEEEVPDRIFIGGGGEKGVLELPFLYEVLKPGGIIVANYIAMEHLAKAVETLRGKKIAFSLKSLSLTTFKEKGFLLSEPERLMFQIKIIKPSESNNE